MNQLLPHVSQSSLGETCSFYLDYITASLPSSLHSLHHKFVTPLISRPSSTSSLLRALASLLDWAASYTDKKNQVPAFLTLVVCAIALVVMSWRSFWRRGSPPYSNNERYGYLAPDDIVDPSSGHGRKQDDDLEPDKLILNHRRVTYELHFPPYSINDGALTIGQLRQSAAEVTHTANPSRIKLLYKGKLLDDDTLPCRLEGLKQQSEILCVVSEVQSGARTPSDLSDAERTSEDIARPPTNVTEIAPKPDKKSKRKKKSKGKKRKSAANSDDGDEASTPTELKPPPQPPRPTSSGNRSSLPPPAPNLKSFPTPLDQVFGLASYFRKELAPLCNQYITDTPADEKARDFEHKKLGETILAQVILKADGIDVDTDESRNARRALIREAQAALNSLDAVNR
ncbi:hypothetical protein BJY00DRAFT_170300 [Aspergillus carlsbadensis]|nr:hypothetical protein BJY00DRAFT_170300 [Aspergillus carlsbadensis]